MTGRTPSPSEIRRPGGGDRCPRCGCRLDGRAERLLDPQGRWFVCVRCGYYAREEDDR